MSGPPAYALNNKRLLTYMPFVMKIQFRDVGVALNTKI